MRLVLCAALIACGGPKTTAPITPVLPDDKAPPIDAPPAKPAPKVDNWAGTLVLELVHGESIGP